MYTDFNTFGHLGKYFYTVGRLGTGYVACVEKNTFAVIMVLQKIFAMVKKIFVMFFKSG